jgi:hypothetical protein
MVTIVAVRRQRVNIYYNTLQVTKRSILISKADILREKNAFSLNDGCHVCSHSEMTVFGCFTAPLFPTDQLHCR